MFKCLFQTETHFDENLWQNTAVNIKLALNILKKSLLEKVEKTIATKIL